MSFAQPPASAIPAGALIKPADLAAALRSPSPPHLLHVGFKVLYDRAHIPGSDYAGPAREPQGLKLLTDRAAALPKGTALVIYCGCCPWDHCPNIAAAYQALSGVSSSLKVLYIEENFGTNWVEKGYPTKQA